MLRDMINTESFPKTCHFIGDLEEGATARLPGRVAHSEVSGRSIHWLSLGLCDRINSSHLLGVKIASPSADGVRLLSNLVFSCFFLNLLVH